MAKIEDSTELCRLSAKWHTDKHTQHSYTPVYDRLFGSRRDSVRTLLEIGVGYPGLMGGNGPEYKAGHSLRMWREYFPHAMVYGIDVQDECRIEEDRLLAVIADQSSVADLKRIAQMWGPFDIVIDDGSHKTEDMIVSAKTLIPYMAPDGIYVVEDVFCPWDVVREVGMTGQVLQLGKQGDDTLVIFRMEDRKA